MVAEQVAGHHNFFKTDTCPELMPARWPLPTAQRALLSLLAQSAAVVSPRQKRVCLKQAPRSGSGARHGFSAQGWGGRISLQSTCVQTQDAQKQPSRLCREASPGLRGIRAPPRASPEPQRAPGRVSCVLSLGDWAWTSASPDLCIWSLSKRLRLLRHQEPHPTQR